MAEVVNLGKIDPQIFVKKFGEILTDEVIITNERIEHICRLKNSVMTFWRIRERNLNKLIKKNEILYKKE